MYTFCDVLQGDPHRPHWSVLPASVRDTYGQRPANVIPTEGEENTIEDDHKDEYEEPDPVLGEDAFAELMEAYYGPSLGHTDGANVQNSTQNESIGLDDHLPAFEAEARAPLYEGAQCSRYICTLFA